MHDFLLSRRHFLGVAGTVAGSIAVWLAASPADLQTASTRHEFNEQVSSFPRYRVLTAAQAAAFDAFAAHVIPTEPGSLGAREAEVTRFADNGLAGFAKAQLRDFTGALATLDAEARRQTPGAASFAALDGKHQIAVIRTMDKSRHSAFEALRAPVIVGMFANPSYRGSEGRQDWKLIGCEDRYSFRPLFGYYDRDAALT